MSSAQKFAVQFRNGVIMVKPSTLLGRRFGVLSRRAVNLSVVSKEALMIGFSKNKEPPAATVMMTTMMTKTRKILTQPKLKIQLKNDGKDDLPLSDLRVVAKHQPKAKNLPAKTSVVNVGVSGIMLRLARNSRKWEKMWNGRETWNYNYHYNLCRMVRYETFSKTHNFFNRNPAIYFPFLLALFTLFTLLIL